MKMKLALDKETIKEFFLDHVEKMVFGLLVVVFVLLIASSFMRERYERVPDDLMNQVSSARKTIADADVDPQRTARNYRAMIVNNRPPREEDYQHTAPWNPPLRNPMERPGRPPILLVRDLQASADRGAFQMKPEADAGGLTRRAGPSGTDSGLRGQRWVVVTGLVPAEEQQRAWDEYFREKFRPPNGDYVPRFIYYRIERAEVPPGRATKDLQWELINVRQARQIETRWQSTAQEVVSERYTHPVLTFPLGPLHEDNAFHQRTRMLTAGAGRDTAWGPEVAHPEIPLRGEAGSGLDEPGMPGDGTPDASEDVPLDDVPGDFGDDSPFGGPRDGRMPRGGGRRAGPGLDRRGEPMLGQSGDGSEEPEFLLFRFFDFDVEPGKSYRYRVKLMLANPLEGVAPRYLARDAADLGSKRWIEGEQWSEPSAAATVPRDTQLLARNVNRLRGSMAQPTGTVAVLKWKPEDGSEVIKEFTVTRGQPLHYPDTVLREPRSRPRDDEDDDRRDRQLRPAPLGDDGPAKEPEKVDFVTGCVTVDLHGGDRLPGRGQSLTEPGYVLVMDPVGRLTILDELEDKAEYERRQASQMSDETEGPMGPETGPGPDGDRGFIEGTPDYFDDGAFPEQFR